MKDMISLYQKQMVKRYAFNTLRLINTLGIGEDSFKRWVKRTSELPSEEECESVETPPRRKKKIQDLESIKQWLDSLPKMPSHYCKQSTNRIYVEPVFHSASHMHLEFSKWYSEMQIEPVPSKTLFKNTLKMKTYQFIIRARINAIFAVVTRLHL